MSLGKSSYSSKFVQFTAQLIIDYTHRDDFTELAVANFTHAQYVKREELHARAEKFIDPRFVEAGPRSELLENSERRAWNSFPISTIRYVAHWPDLAYPSVYWEALQAQWCNL